MHYVVSDYSMNTLVITADIQELDIPLLAE